MSTISENIYRLINKKIDGELTEAEARRFDDLLSDDEKVRTYYRQMEMLDHSLQEAGKEKETADVSREVMEHVQQTGPDKKQSGKVRMQKRFLPPGQTMLRYAAVLIIGLLIGAASILFIRPETVFVDEGDMRATMTARSGQSLNIRQEDWHLQINPMVMNEAVILIASLQSESDLEVHMSFNPDIYQLVRTKSLKGDIERLPASNAGSVAFPATGDVMFQLVMNQRSGMTGPVQVSLLQDNRTIYQSEIFID